MLNDMKKKCGECGMIVFQNEYHPYAACILYKQTRQAEKVQDLLRDIASYGYQAAENGVALEDALRNIAASDVVAGENELASHSTEPELASYSLVLLREDQIIVNALGYITALFQDTETGKFYMPKAGFTVSGKNLESMFNEVKPRKPRDLRKFLDLLDQED